MSNIGRKLPATYESRRAALNKAKSKKDSVPAADNILSTDTSDRLDAIEDAYSLAMKEVRNKLQNSTDATKVIQLQTKKLHNLNSHHIQNLNMMILDEVVPVNYREYFGMPLNSKAAPKQDTENEVEHLSTVIISAAATIEAAHGTAIPYPLALTIQNQLTTLKASQLNHMNTLDEVNNAKLSLKALNAEADAVILKVWDEAETYYNHQPTETKRNLCRGWGVVYVSSNPPIAISCHIMELINGAPQAVEGMDVVLVETDESAVTGPEGGVQLKTHTVGDVTIRLSMEGYADKQVHFKIKEGENIDLGVVMVLRNA